MTRVVYHRLRAVIDDANEDNVHRLRTSIRRLNSCLELFPRSIRDQKKTRKFAAAYSKLLKLSSKIRDTDVMLSRLSKLEANPSVEPLLTDLRSSRSSQLEAVREMAEASQRLQAPKVQAGDLSNPKLRKRFDKIVSRLTSKIARALPIVVKDPANIKELHVLRLDCKRLRYSLELNPAQRTPRLLGILESWQELLGSIHDNDILIDYLRQSEKLAEIQTELEDETNLRTDSYNKFVEIAKKNPMTTIAVTLNQ